MSKRLFVMLYRDELERDDLRPLDKLLLGVLRDHVGHHDDAWPAVRTLAKEVGCKSMDTVQTALARLERTGDVIIDRQGHNRVNHYRLSVPPGGTVSPSQSVPPGGTPAKRKCTASRYTGVPPGGAQLYRQPVQNHKDPLNQTQKARRPKAPPDPRVRVFIDSFCQTYKAAKGRPYVVAGGKDGQLVKTILQALDREGIDALAELQKAAQTMLSDTWGWTNASIGVLASQINKWRGKLAKGDARRQPSFTKASTTDDYDALAIPAEAV